MKLIAKGLHKSFGEKQVLKGVGFEAEGGKALGLLGRNGAGKTTIIRILMGVFPADSGEVLFNGELINRSEINFGYLPEERGLYPKKVIIDQLIYFGMLKGMSKRDAEASADRLLKRLDMTEYRNKRLDTLSKGNSQKIQLAAALISNPDIVILDEPFSGLDPVNASLLKDVIKEIIADGKIVLFSSHQMNYIEEFCDDIAILNGGEIVLSGKINEIKRSYDRRTIIVESKDIEKIKQYLNDNSIIEDNQLKITLDKAEDKSKLISQLSESDFDIDGIRVFEPSLNDIFVEYTEDKSV